MKNIYLAILLFASINLYGQTAGTLSFTATTLNYSAPYSPKHILAIWISQQNNTWVKTRKFLAQSPLYKQYLTNFKNATSSTYNAVDAITGPTLLTHQTHTVTWDGKNVSGTLVPDGNYRVYIEYTSANTTGKIYYVDFVKGPSAQTLNPANQTYFTNIQLTWTPASSDVPTTEQQNFNVAVSPNPFSENTVISIQSAENCILTMTFYDILGNKVSVPFSRKITSGKSEFSLSELTSYSVMPDGMYFLEVIAGKSRKVISVIRKH